MVNLNVIRTYANRDGCLNFRLSNSDGEWYGLYKGVRFDFDQTVEDLDYQLNKVKKQSKVDAELKNPHMANKLIGVMTYNYTEEDVAFIMVNFVKCSEEAEKIGSELLTNVGFKHVLDDEKLEEIFNKVTLEGLRKGLDNYVGYLVVDAGFNVDTFNHRMGGKIVKEELNLLDFQKFSDAIKAANVKYHMDWIVLVDRIMMKKFNAIISERYRSLYFSDPNEVESYVKVRGYKMWKLSLDVLRSYVNVDTHFRLKDDGTWCGIYKDYPFDFEDNEESLKKELNEKIEKSKIIPEFSPSEMEANALKYEYTREDKVYLSNLFSDCKLKAQKERQESLDKVGYKEELDRKKLTEIYNLTTVNDVYTALSEYVGYLIEDSTLKVKVKLNFPFSQKSEEVMRTLDLFNLEEFIHYLELANEYYKANMSYVSFIALRSFNEKIKERFPTLQFRTSYDIPYYRKEIS